VQEVTELSKQLQQDDLEIPHKKSRALGAPKESTLKKIALGTGDPSKMVTISVELTQA
jgi:hypothetical protein